MAKQKSDLAVLAPQPVVWEIGGQTFEQKPLPLERLADVLDAVVDELLESGNISVLESLVSEGKESLNKSDTVKVGLKIAASLPRSLPKVAAAVLGADEAHMREHLSMRTAIAILRTFIAQNDVGALVQDFFDLIGEFQTATAETPKAKNENGTG